MPPPPLTFLYAHPVRQVVHTTPLPLAGLHHLRSAPASLAEGAALLAAWLVQRSPDLTHPGEILAFFEPQERRLITAEEVIRRGDSLSGKTLYIITQQMAAEAEAEAGAEQPQAEATASVARTTNTQDQQADQASSSAASSSSSSAAAAAAAAAPVTTASPFLFSLRTGSDSNAHRRVSLSDVGELLILRRYTRHIPMELLWGMMLHVLQGADGGASSGRGPGRESIVALVHALLMHVNAKQPNVFPATNAPPNTPFTVPPALTAMLVRLFELLQYDRANLQEQQQSGGSPAESGVDTQQLMSALIQLVKGDTWDQLYLAFSLFKDEQDDEEEEEEESKEEDEQGRAVSSSESLTRSQFLRFLRSLLLPLVVPLSLRTPAPTVLSWVDSTANFVADNLTQLFGLEAADGHGDGVDEEVKISFMHLLQFHKSFPNILAFLTAGEQMDEMMALAEQRAAAVNSAPSGASNQPSITTQRRRAGTGANSFQPLSPLEEVTDEGESPASTPLGNVAHLKKEAESNSPLFSFANHSKPSTVRASAAAATSASASSAPVASSAPATASSSSLSPSSSSSSPDEFTSALLVDPASHVVLKLDPSHLQMLRSVYRAFSHLTVADLLLLMQRYEEGAEMDESAFKRAVEEMLDAQGDLGAKARLSPEAHRMQVWRHCRQLFDLFDLDHSGVVDVLELCVCLSTLCDASPPDTKLRFAFHLLDEDSDGLLNEDEMSELFMALLRGMLPDATNKSHAFLERVVEQYAKPLFQMARAQPDQHAEDGQASESVSYPQFRAMLDLMTPHVGFLSIIARLLDPEAVLFGAGVAAYKPAASIAAAGATSSATPGTESKRPRKRWDKSTSSIPTVWMQAEEGEEEEQSEADERQASRPQPVFQAWQEEEASSPSTAAASTPSRHKRRKSLPFVSGAPLTIDPLASPTAPTLPSFTSDFSNPHRQLEVFQLWRTQQEAMAEAISQVKKRYNATKRPRTQQEGKEAPTTPSVRFAQQERQQRGATSQTPASPAFSLKPRELENWKASVTPRKPGAAQRQGQGQKPSSASSSGCVSSPPSRPPLPLRPLTLSLLPSIPLDSPDASSFSASVRSPLFRHGFPDSIEYGLSDQGRLWSLVRLMRAFQPIKKELKFLSPAAVIMKALQPAIEENMQERGGAGGEPVVKGRDFMESMRFLLDNTELAEEDSDNSEELLKCCLFAFAQSPSSQAESMYGVRSLLDHRMLIQDFLLGIEVVSTSGPNWSQAFHLIDTQGRGLINKQQLAHLFECCIRLLLGVHEGVRRLHKGSLSTFHDLVSMLVDCSVSTFFPIADQDGTGVITLADFQRVRLRYPNLVPWVGLISGMHKMAQGGNNVEQEEEQKRYAEEQEIQWGAREESPSPSASEGEEGEEGGAFETADSSDPSNPILSVELYPSLSSSTVPPSYSLPLRLHSSDLYHFFFLRSLCAHLDADTLMTSIKLRVKVLREEQARRARRGSSGFRRRGRMERRRKGWEGMTEGELQEVMSSLLPVATLAPSHLRLLRSLLHQLFLLLAVVPHGGGVRAVKRVRVEHVILVLLGLLPSARGNEDNIKRQWEYVADNFSAFRTALSPRSRGQLDAAGVSEVLSAQLHLLLCVSSSCFRSSARSGSVLLRGGVTNMVCDVSQVASGYLMALAHRDQPSSLESTLSFQQFAQVYGEYPSILPWVEVIDGLVEGEHMSSTGPQQQQQQQDEARFQPRPATTTMYEAPEQVYPSPPADIGYGSDSSDEGLSTLGSIPASPQLTAAESAMLLEALASPSPMASPPRGREDKRQRVQAEKRTGPASLSLNAALQQRQQQQQQQQQQQAKAPVAASSSRRSSTSSASSASSQSSRRLKKSRAGPHTLSVDPFAVTMSMASNPSPRAVISAATTKPLPVFTVTSAAPKLILCIPMHADEEEEERQQKKSGASSSYGGHSIQSLKVYDSDLVAFSFFKNKLKYMDEEGLLNWFVNTARVTVAEQGAGQRGKLTPEQLLFHTRLNRMEFSACLTELLYGDGVSSSPVFSPTSSTLRSSPRDIPRGHLEQALSYSVALFRQLDHDSRGSVCLVELLLGLILFLSISPEDKLRFIYRVLDAERTGKVSVDRVQTFYRAVYTTLSALCSTQFRMSVPSAPPTPIGGAGSRSRHGPLSPSSIHSLPHEVMQDRLEVTARFQAKELFRLAGVSPSSKSSGGVSAQQFLEVLTKQNHLLSFMRLFELETVFSPTNQKEEPHTSRQRGAQQTAQPATQRTGAFSATSSKPMPPPVQVPSFISSAPMGSPTSNFSGLGDSASSGPSFVMPSISSLASPSPSASSFTPSASPPLSSMEDRPRILLSMLLHLDDAFATDMGGEDDASDSDNQFLVLVSAQDMQMLSLLRNEAGLARWQPDRILSVLNRYAEPTSAAEQAARRTGMEPAATALSLEGFRQARTDILQMEKIQPQERAAVNARLDRLFFCLADSTGAADPSSALVDVLPLCIALSCMIGASKHSKATPLFQLLDGAGDGSLSPPALQHFLHALLALLLAFNQTAESLSTAFLSVLARQQAHLYMHKCFTALSPKRGAAAGRLAAGQFQAILANSAPNPPVSHTSSTALSAPMRAEGIVPWVALLDLMDRR